MRLIQYRTAKGERAVAARQGEEAFRRLRDSACVFDLARAAIAGGGKLDDEVAGRLGEAAEPFDEIVASGRLLPPIDHSDSRAHWLTGTGFTHMVPSAQAERRANPPASEGLAAMGEAQKLIAKGVMDGKPAAGETGLQPEWFYKGDGRHLVAPGGELVCPAYGKDGSEEAEVAAHYVIGEDGTPYRIGFSLGNEFTDHAMDAENAYYLSHAKIRPCSFGPELLLGDLPPNIEGRTRIYRGENVVFEAPFWCGEDNMTHSLANLEHHHFKYELFRRPGDLHTHFLGTTTMSYPKGVRLEEGDIIELQSETFGASLRNAVRADDSAPAVVVRTL